MNVSLNVYSEPLYAQWQPSRLKKIEPMQHAKTSVSPMKAVPKKPVTSHVTKPNFKNMFTACYKNSFGL